MPSVNEAQRRLFSIAEHSPEKLRPENRDLAKLPRRTLHDFAATKRYQMASEKGAKRP